MNHHLTRATGAFLVNLCGLVLCCAATAQGNFAVSLDGVSGKGTTRLGSVPIANSTWEAWIRVNTYDQSKTYWAPILFRWGMNSTGAPNIRVSDGTARGSWPRHRTPAISKPGALTPGHWHHVATVYGSGSSPSHKLFIDGLLAASSSGPNTPYGSTWELILGAEGYIGYANFMKADVDEIRLSTVPRYTNNFTPPTRFTPDAQTFGLWHFDAGSGSIARDASGNGHDFKLSGGFSWVPGQNAARATYALFGTACRGSSGLPQLAPATGSLPRLGTTFELIISNLSTWQQGILFAGASNQLWSGVPLPFGLAPLGMPGCTLYLSPDLGTQFSTGFSTQYTWSIFVPNQPGLLGLYFYQQAFIFDPAANGLGVIASNAGKATVGL